jgi:two-component system chemotaxis sensor kinase CheA
VASGLDGGRVALGMSVVRRLELIGHASVERSGPLEVVRYRGGILPLLAVAETTDRRVDQAAVRADLLQVVVCESSVGLVGLVVGRIEDVVDEPAATAQPPTRRGVVARLVVDDLVTELLDLESIVADAGLEATG